MIVNSEILMQPSSYEISDRAPLIDWFTDDQLRYIQDNFDKVRTEYNIVAPREMKHRICLVSNISESLFNKIYHIFRKVLFFRRHSYVLGYSLVVFMENNTGEVAKFELSEDYHCAYFSNIDSEAAFKLFKSRFQFVFNRDSSNRFKDLQNVNLLRNMRDKQRPEFLRTMNGTMKRRWYWNKRIIMPICLNIHVKQVRRDQSLPFLIGSRGVRLIRTENIDDDGYTSD